jgi:hypothetical protein
MLGLKNGGFPQWRTQLVFLSSLLAMKPLPQTGTVALLELLSPHLDDRFINDLFPRQPCQGRHASFSPAQLLRVQLLQLLTPAHSGNLLIKLLPENRGWRDFARLPSKRCLPDAKMLHQFRERLDLIKLRQINRQLLTPILADLDPARKTVAIIDATDLPASTNCFKKKYAHPYCLTGGGRCPDGQERAEPLVCRLQKTHTALVGGRNRRASLASAADELGRARQPL